MTLHRVDLDTFARIVASLDTNIEGAIIRGLRSAARRLQGLVVEEIDGAEPYPAVDRGTLRGSVQYSRASDGADVYVDAPHAPHLEYGTRPHWAPLEPLIGWVLRKRLAGDEDEAEGIARAIQLNIAMFGMEPRNYFGKAFQRVMPVIIEEVERELGAL